MFIGVGTHLNLTCRQTEAELRALDDENRSSLKWSHNNQVNRLALNSLGFCMDGFYVYSICQEMNHHSPRGVFVSVTQQDGTSISHLIVRNVTQSDAGLYKCFTSSEVYASTVVHVVGGK
jgi:hypothetical protein